MSKGPASIKLPDYTGLKVDQYTALLSQKNVKFEKKATSDTHGVKDGYVVKCSKEIGETVNVKDSEKVTVYYAKSGGSSSSSSTSSKRTDKNYDCRRTSYKLCDNCCIMYKVPK